ncbi:MAG: glycosyltransferase [Candidatus Helarchaeota archaeon]
MGKIRYLLYGSIILGIFALIHSLFPREWSYWLRRSDLFFSGPPFGFRVMYILGCFFFFAFTLLFGINFLASFGGPRYPKGSKDFTPPISVLMPAINEEKTIGGTLTSFSQTTYPKDNLEIVVIASGSNDKTVEVCREFEDQLNIKILTDPLPKKGKPAALNYGLKHSSHDIILVYDADTQLYENTLQNLVRHLYNPDITATSGPVTPRNWRDNKLTKGITLEYTFLSGTGLYHEIRDRLGRSLWLLGRNYAIRKAVIEELGGWNEDALTEDLHLSAQLSSAKKKIKFAPHAMISEKIPNTKEAFLHQRRRWVGGYSQSLSSAMELDTRTVILRNFAMMHYGHTLDFSIGALIPALIFGLIGEYYIMLICLITFLFGLGTFIMGIRKYSEGKYKLLLYFPVTIYIDITMFRLQFKNYEDLEWEKTIMD